MVDAIGALTVRSALAFEDPEHDLAVRRGANQLDGAEAVGFARFRFPEGRLRAPGEPAAAAGGDPPSCASTRTRRASWRPARSPRWQHLETELSPADLYRFAQAVTQIDPGQTAPACQRYRRDEDGVSSVVYLDDAQAQARGRRRGRRRDAPGQTGVA